MLKRAMKKKQMLNEINGIKIEDVDVEVDVQSYDDSFDLDEIEELQN